MKFWLRHIARPTCARCSKSAAVTLMNSFNAELAHYCLTCGKREKLALERAEAKKEPRP
jgi:RNase P subunit RPR2